jgi:serine/threonine protein kinase
MVERDGQNAFLKAIDFSRAQHAPDFVRTLQKLTEAFNFERDLLWKCSARRMDRVISPIDDGEVKVDDSFLGRVNYLIFEAANDIRIQLEACDTFDTTLKLRALHHIATGMYQLNSADIAHQDLKPSNVLTVGTIAKVGDLGSASLKGTHGPMDDEICAGTRAYAPPELLYHHLDPDFTMRRFGCDVYLFGSLVVFFFAGVSTTAGILDRLHIDLRPGAWSGTYQEVLPYVRDAFDQLVRSFSSDIQSTLLRAELVEVVRQLCDPQPTLRGHPLNRLAAVGNRFSLQRYVNKFDLLATRSRVGLL